MIYVPKQVDIQCTVYESYPYWILARLDENDDLLRIYTFERGPDVDRVVKNHTNNMTVFYDGNKTYSFPDSCVYGISIRESWEEHSRHSFSEKWRSMMNQEKIEWKLIVHGLGWNHKSNTSRIIWSVNKSRLEKWFEVIG